METNIRKIMLSTDFSETSKDATEYAAWLAQQLHAELKLLHVFDPSIYTIPSPYYFMPGFDDWYSGNIEAIRSKGEETLEQLKQSFEGRAEAMFVEGKPEDMIVEAAKEWGAELIVVGTHGYTGWNRFTLGSVAEHVIRNAHCPVLTIKAKASKD